MVSMTIMINYLKSLSPIFWKINLRLYLQFNKPFQRLQAPSEQTIKSSPCHTASFSVNMKISSILTASTLFGVFASATPLSALDTRAFQVGVTFYGADEGTYFSQIFLANEDPVKISKFLFFIPKSQHPGRHKLSLNLVLLSKIDITTLCPLYEMNTPSPLSHQVVFMRVWGFWCWPSYPKTSQPPQRLPGQFRRWCHLFFHWCQW